MPNGNPAPGPKYDYKLAWMERLHARVEAVLAAEEAVVVAGDYNVIPQDEDAGPEAWRRDALGLPATRDAFRRILNLGLTDAYRIRNRGRGTTRSGTTRPTPTSGTAASASTTPC